jgi:polysaccharide biosynthesis protein PslH
MRVLFVKEALRWPRSSGHDVHCFYMMESLQGRDVELSLLTAEPCTSKSIEGLRLGTTATFQSLPAATDEPKLTGLQRRFQSYWGVSRQRIVQVGELARQTQADAVVVVGLHVLPYLAAVQGAQRIWYAADEWFLHHWTQFRWLQRRTWPELKAGIVKGLYERSYASCVDRVWVVSSADAKAVRRIMRRPAVDVIPNGVDATHYAPRQAAELPYSLVFWGRLDFGPNIDAIAWFAENVFAPLRREEPRFTWTVYGFQAVEQVRRMAKQYGFQIVEDLPDLRDQVATHQTVVLPFVSGAGIKNKFLEAAAMARPIVASAMALNGVERFGFDPCRVADSPSQWIRLLKELAADIAQRTDLGAQARQWVVKHYAWESAAEIALRGMTLPQSSR